MNSSRWSTRRLVPMLALGAALVALPLVASPAAGDDGGRPFSTELTGAQEVSNGDPNGTGQATLTVNVGLTEICYQLQVSGLEGTVLAAHIHEAPAGVNGPIVVPLVAPVSGTSAACTAVERDLAQKIVVNPEGYYVNVHTNVRPAGAVRGQLSRMPG